MNEIREQLVAQRGTFITRDEFDPLKEATHLMISRKEHEAFVAQLNIAAKLDNDNLRAAEDRSEQGRSALMVRIVSLESKFWLGGTGIIILMTGIQLLLNAVWHKP